MIERSDIITCESYKPLCDYVYHPGVEPVGGLVHVNMEEIPHFFSAIKGRTDQYIVVSTCSDFGICLQEQNPVYADMIKWARMMMKPSTGYGATLVEPRCDVKKCSLTDKYSVKCYSYTAFTLPEIPENVVHWFTSNANLYDDKITVVPFGISPGSADKLYEHTLRPVTKKEDRLLYINWQDYTVDRFEIREEYKWKKCDWITIVEQAKPYEEYLTDIAEHQFILSPPGNGIDCYRNLESIYLGSIPIVQATAATDQFSQGIGTMLLGMFLKEIQLSVLKGTASQIKPSIGPMAKLSYWKEQFANAKEKFIL